MARHHVARPLALPCALAAAALALLPLLAQQPKGKRYALLVGVNEYDSKHLGALSYPEADVTETADGLPFVGNAPGHDPRVHFVMAYGGNGITYSTIAAAMVREAIAGRRHPLDTLFGFARLAA